MNLLNDLVLEGQVAELEQTLDEVIDAFEALVNEVAGNPAVRQLPNGMDDAKKLEVASQRLEAAKRGLQLVNKLPNGPEKQAHRSRVFSNLNMIRSLLRDVIAQANNDGGAFGRSQMATKDVPNVHTPRV